MNAISHCVEGSGRRASGFRAHVAILPDAVEFNSRAAPEAIGCRPTAWSGRWSRLYRMRIRIRVRSRTLECRRCCATRGPPAWGRIGLPVLMTDAFICDAIRTPFGRYGGTLANIRADDLAAIPIRALMERNPGVDWQAVDDVVFGCANQAGEDNRNVARM